MKRAGLILLAVLAFDVSIFANELVLNKGIEYSYQNRPYQPGIEKSINWHRAESLISPPGRNGRNYLWFKLPIPDKPGASNALYLNRSYDSFEVFIGQQKLYSFGDVSAQQTELETGHPFHLIQLPQNLSANHLLISVYTVHERIGISGVARLNTMQKHIRRVALDNFDELLVSFLLFTVGIFSLSLLIKQEQRAMLISYGVYAVIAALWTFSFSHFKQILFTMPSFWYHIETLAFSIMAIPLSFLFAKTFKSRFRIIVKIQWVANAALCFVCWALYGLDQMRLADIGSIFQFTMLINLVLWYIFVFGSASFNNRDEVILVVGACLMGFTAFFDLFSALNLLGSVPTLVHWGFFIFTISMLFKIDSMLFASLRARKNAEEANEAKSRFLAYMSHELRTPLNAVSSMTELLLRSDLDNRQRTFSATIAKATRSLAATLDDILDISLLEEEQVAIKQEPFKIRAIIDEVIQLLSEKANQTSNVVYQVVARQVPIAVMGDARRLRQVLLNLVNNALNYTQRGQIGITVNLDSSDNKPLLLHFKVFDNGPGIPPEKLPKIFERYMRVDDLVGARGTGLGLAISKRLIELMGGSIQAETSERGSSFEFSLKMGNVAGFSRPIPETTEAPMAPAILDGAKCSILLVEDEALSLMGMQALLEELGYVSQGAPDGIVACDLLAKNQYDIVMLDVRMPNMDGLELTRFIYDTYSDERPFIVGISGDVFKKSIETYRQVGMDYFISKPVTLASLQGAIETWHQQNRVPR